MASEKIRDDAYRAADQLSADAITDADAKLRQARFSDEAKAVRDAHYSAAADVRAVGYRRCITQTPMVMGNAPRLLAPPPVFPQNFATLTQNQCNHYLQLAQSTGIHMPRTILSEGGGVSTA